MTKELVVPGIGQEDIGTLLNVRTYSQYVEMVKRILSDKCPFCKLDTNLNKVLHQRSNWKMWRNPFPANHTVEHLILAPDRHVTNLDEMTPEDWQAFRNLLYCFYDFTNYKGGAIVMRFGHPNLNAGSVRHLHANIIVPSRTGEVRITLAKEPKEIEKKKKILAVFERVRTGTKIEYLTPEELILVGEQINQ